MRDREIVKAWSADFIKALEEAFLQLSGLWRAAGEPGRVTTELMCAGSTRAHDPARVAALLGQVIG